MGNADIVLNSCCDTLKELREKNDAYNKSHLGSPLPGSHGPCGAACRLRHPEKHVQCLAGLLHKYLQMRTILPGFLLESVKRWWYDEDYQFLFKDMPPVSHPAI